MKRLLPFLMFVLVLASTVPALADGGYFLRDLGAATSPEQRDGAGHRRRALHVCLRAVGGR